MPLSFSEFPETSYEDWLQAIRKELKDKPLDSLNWQISSDLIQPPYYTPTDWAISSGAITHTTGWEIGEEIPMTGDLSKTNQLLLNALEGGVQAPLLVFRQLPSKDDLGKIFEGVALEMISTHFSLSGTRPSDWNQLLEHLHKLLVFRNINPEKISFTFHLDPTSENRDLPAFTEKWMRLFPKIRLFSIDGKAHWTGDAGVIEELTSALEKGIALLRMFESSGINIKQLQRHLQFSLSIGNSYFLEIAKIRSLKLLWGNVLRDFGISHPEPVFTDICLAPDKLEDNPHTNLIRATTQAMAAVTGGADRLTLIPAELQTPEMSRRITRNIQHILQLESGFDKVADPAAGSYYVENLTQQLCLKTWERLAF